MMNTKPQAMRALGSKAANAFTPALNNVSGMSNRKTLDAIPRGPKPLNYAPQKEALKAKFKQYGDKGYNPVGKNVTKN